MAIEGWEWSRGIGWMPGIRVEEQEGKMMEMRDSQDDDRDDRKGRRREMERKDETGRLWNRTDGRDRR